MPEEVFDKQIDACGEGARTFANSDLPVGAEAPDLAACADPAADEVTGASPGTAQACDDLGLNSLAANLERFNIKPPGVS